DLAFGAGAGQCSDKLRLEMPATDLSLGDRRQILGRQGRDLDDLAAVPNSPGDLVEIVGEQHPVQEPQVEIDLQEVLAHPPRCLRLKEWQQGFRRVLPSAVAYVSQLAELVEHHQRIADLVLDQTLHN